MDPQTHKGVGPTGQTHFGDHSYYNGQNQWPVTLIFLIKESEEKQALLKSICVNEIQPSWAFCIFKQI